MKNEMGFLRKAVTPQTPFLLGSLRKSTADVEVMQLVE